MIAIFVLFITLLSSPLSVSAQEYQLELHQIMDNETNNPPSQILPLKNRQEFIENGFSILSIDSDSTITFKIDKTSIPTDDLSSGKEFIYDSQMKIDQNGNGNTNLVYQLSQDLETASGQSIPGTKCDNYCNNKIPGVWKRTDSYGWGYSIDGGNTYRPFVTETDKLDNLPVQTKYSSKSNPKLTFKINLHGNFPSGIYHATIKLIALPDF